MRFDFKGEETSKGQMLLGMLSDETGITSAFVLKCKRETNIKKYKIQVNVIKKCNT